MQGHWQAAGLWLLAAPPHLGEVPGEKRSSAVSVSQHARRYSNLGGRGLGWGGCLRKGGLGEGEGVLWLRHSGAWAWGGGTARAGGAWAGEVATSSGAIGIW